MSMRTSFVILSLTVMTLLSGCQCCGWTENYADAIDDIADHQDFKRGLDDCYCEKLDVSRWCMNRRCPPSNCQQCR